MTRSEAVAKVQGARTVEYTNYFPVDLLEKQPPLKFDFLPGLPTTANVRQAPEWFSVGRCR
jgi:hypothetical protein